MNAQPNRLYHLTFNTGDVRLSPRAEVSNDVLQIMREKGMPGSADGDSDFGFIAGYHVCITRYAKAAVFSLFKDGKEPIPLALCGLALSENHNLWNQLESAYLAVTDKHPVGWDAPEEPESTPWLAVVLLPGLVQDMNTMQWLANFERSLAWLIIESENS